MTAKAIRISIFILLYIFVAVYITQLIGSAYASKDTDGIITESP